MRSDLRPLHLRPQLHGEAAAPLQADPTWGRHSVLAKAWVASFCVVATAYAALRWQAGAVLPDQSVLLTATVCTVGGLISRLADFEVLARRGVLGSSPDDIFFVAAALLLPTRWLVGVCIAVVVAEGCVRRSAWYRHSYNLGTLVLTSLSAQQLAAHSLGEAGLAASPARLLATATLVVAPAVVINVIAGHAILRLVHGMTLRRSRLASVEVVAMRTTAVVLGLLLAVLWSRSPVLGLLLVPLVLSAYRDASVPTMQHESRSDSKTGLYNAGYFRESAAPELRRCQRSQAPVSVMLLDIDHLGRLNNTLGHLAGDAAIVAVAEALRSSVRDSDIASRFGGEEFAVLLPDTDGREAADVAERVRSTLAGTRLQAPGITTEVYVTVSIGVGQRHAQEGIDQLMKRVDDALYAAKASGRDQVSTAAMTHHLPTQRT